MNKNTLKKNTTILFPLLLFVIFTACILSVLLTGADVYRKISLRDQNSFYQRTVSQYLTTRLRQSDSENMVFVSSFQGDTQKSEGSVLYLQEELGDREFYTRIYCHEGYLRELFSPSDLSLPETAGEKILEVSDLSFALEDQLLTVDIVYSDGTCETLILHLRNGKEVSS